MMDGLPSILSWVVTGVMVVLAASLVLTLVRLLLGPSTPDRVVALDMFATVVVGVIAVYSIASQRPEVLRTAIVLALIIFLGTVAFARYVEKRGAP